MLQFGMVYVGMFMKYDIYLTNYIMHKYSITLLINIILIYYAPKLAISFIALNPPPLTHPDLHENRSKSYLS